MPKKWWWKFSFVLIIVVFGLYTVIPSFWNIVSEKPIPKFFKEEKLKLGLDLQGGLHLVLGVNIKKALEAKLQIYNEDLKEALSEKKFAFKSVVVDDSKEYINLRFNNIAQYEASIKEIKKYIMTSFSILEYIDDSSGPSNLVLKLKYNEKEKQYFINSTVSQSLETIRNRIDEFGVSEPSIQTQGTERIIVQLPGVKDPERAKKLIGKTAKLEFKLVDESMGLDSLVKLVDKAEKAGVKYVKGEKFSLYVDKLNDFLKKDIPVESMMVFKRKTDPVANTTTSTPFLVKKATSLTGAEIRDAGVSMNREFNEPYVSLTMNPRGAKLFSDVTGANVGKRLAIVLDGIVDSAPVIKSRIPNGRATIELGSGADNKSLLEEAKDLAITLRAGALPADIEFLEERTVGPSLGRDSILQGSTAMKYGAVIVVIFMVIYYNLSGILANLALILNVLFIGSILTAFQATLTLPGIAGIVLTIGMAVDANVIIFERIREELMGKQAPATAVTTGFGKAFTAILDANITTMITGLVLLQYGSGPIKGFAVTLIIGIVCSLFTAVFVTRIFFELVTTMFPKNLSI
jgi:protein-export membrane protein SecD